MGERTGSRVFQWVWSYVVVKGSKVDYIVGGQRAEFDLSELVRCVALLRQKTRLYRLHRPPRPPIH
ncbi:hypothetical protein CLIM01_09122 [Colletotrichum limetticola]|uniref:Uncharacterized protein n=1 Tax=Colletotrichum limetticola TaxID=1209924 RepID=A0ABQ9PPP7_9PEZI|nr:hypothetical protein CLIM01_09122 [Colletotrichum limetticola]